MVSKAHFLMIGADWIANREFALICWLVLLLGYATYLPNVRGHLKTVVELFFSQLILTVVIWVAVAIGFGLLIFEPDSGWSARHFWIAFLWYVTVGTGLAFKMGTSENAEWKGVGTILLGVFSITALFDFIINFRSLSLLTEIILVPVLAFATWCTVSRSAKEILPSSAILGNVILTSIAVVWIFKSIYSIYVDPSKFFSIENFRSFYLPFLLCFCILPILVVVFLVSIYQTTLLSLSLTLRDDYLYKYACKAAILRFNINVSALKHWRRIVHHGNTKSVAEIDQTISEAIESAIESKHHEK